MKEQGSSICADKDLSPKKVVKLIKYRGAYITLPAFTENIVRKIRNKLP